MWGKGLEACGPHGVSKPLPIAVGYIYIHILLVWLIHRATHTRIDCATAGRAPCMAGADFDCNSVHLKLPFSSMPFNHTRSALYTCSSPASPNRTGKAIFCHTASLGEPRVIFVRVRRASWCLEWVARGWVLDAAAGGRQSRKITLKTRRILNSRAPHRGIENCTSRVRGT